MAEENVLCQRLRSIQASLWATYLASKSLEKELSTVKGTEREVFVTSFLREMFPPQFRFGSGFVVDADGNMTGQLDVIVELPLAPSFSIGPGAPRVYLADTVGAVIEVKSDLRPASEWKRLEHQLRARTNRKKPSFKALNEVKRQVLVQRAIGEIGESQTIPAYAVGYEGFANLTDLEARMKQKIREAQQGYISWLRGVLIIKQPTLFVGNDGTTAQGPRAIGEFINSLHWELQRIVPNPKPANLKSYFRNCKD